MRWREIRTACEDAGLPIREWEEQLHDRLLTHLVTHLPNGVERYHTDAVFHAQIHTLVSLVVSHILNRDPLSEPLLRGRAEELGDLFRSEAGLDPL